VSKRVDPGSFRDPSGFVFVQDGILYRQVNVCWREEYDLLNRSGLYHSLVRDGLMIPHEEVEGVDGCENAYKVLKPRRIPFISYPYEWCFSQLKDAALLTLEIQKKALAHGMSLKDASAFNVQFVDGRPVFIDTISFEQYREGDPWVAYRQFCMHFLAPLALMSRRDIRLNQWFRVTVEGVPLDLASSLLPFLAKLHPSLFMHIYLHARSQKRYAGKSLPGVSKRTAISKFGLVALLDSLEGGVRRLNWTPSGTEWADYYQDTNYSKDGFASKQHIVADYIKLSAARTVWDLGANDGAFSRVAAGMGCHTVSFDIDPACVEKNYRSGKMSGERDVLPLLLDLTNPSPGLGWATCERTSVSERGPCDLALALALIHHLAIGHNVPFANIAEYFASIALWLVVEFVPKEDSQVQRMLATRKDVFSDYDQPHFEVVFSRYFSIQAQAVVPDSKRRLYLMKRL